MNQNIFSRLVIVLVQYVEKEKYGLFLGAVARYQLNVASAWHCSSSP